MGLFSFKSILYQPLYLAKSSLSHNISISQSSDVLHMSFHNPATPKEGPPFCSFFFLRSTRITSSDLTIAWRNFSVDVTVRPWSRMSLSRVLSFPCARIIMLASFLSSIYRPSNSFDTILSPNHLPHISGSPRSGAISVWGPFLSAPSQESNTVQWVKGLPRKPDNLSLIPRTYDGRRKLTSKNCFLICTCTLRHMHTPWHTHNSTHSYTSLTHRIIIKK